VSEAPPLLREAGADNPNRMLGPLLSAALDNALRLGDAGLTGPVARGDDGTVAAHVAAGAGHAPAPPPASSTSSEPADEPRPHPRRAGRRPGEAALSRRGGYGGSLPRGTSSRAHH